MKKKKLYFTASLAQGDNLRQARVIFQCCPNHDKHLWRKLWHKQNYSEREQKVGPSYFSTHATKGESIRLWCPADKGADRMCVSHRIGYLCYEPYNIQRFITIMYNTLNKFLDDNRIYLFYNRIESCTTLPVTTVHKQDLVCSSAT